MVLFQTEFIADELGYRPVGEHIHPAFVQVDNWFFRWILTSISVSDGAAGQVIGREEEGRFQGTKASERRGKSSKKGRQGCWQEEALEASRIKCIQEWGFRFCTPWPCDKVFWPIRDQIIFISMIDQKSREQIWKTLSRFGLKPRMWWWGGGGLLKLRKGVWGCDYF